MSDRSAEEHLRRALEELARAAGIRLSKHPLGHLVKRRRDAVLELNLSVPVPAADGVSRDGVTAEAVERAYASLGSELDALLAHRNAFRPGRVFCLRCSTTDCEHAAPADSRQVFAGYGPTGIPRFLDFGQWLLQRRHPEIDRLYRRPPRLLTDLASGRELDLDLLPEFADRRIDFRIHGQVTAGWFEVPTDIGPGVLALSFQVLSSAHGDRRKKRRHRRLGLNVLGSGPAGEPLEDLYDRLETIPWSPAVAWSQSALESIERSQGRKSATPEQLSQRVEGVLRGIVRRLLHHRRARSRRTDHAQRRHRAGDRPTRMALEDLARAGDESILVDSRRETVVVLGERGRAHIFNASGQLVTSVRYSSDSIARKKKQGRWRPATGKEIAGLRGAVERRADRCEKS